MTGCFITHCDVSFATEADTKGGHISPLSAFNVETIGQKETWIFFVYLRDSDTINFVQCVLKQLLCELTGKLLSGPQATTSVPQNTTY